MNKKESLCDVNSIFVLENDVIVGELDRLKYSKYRLINPDIRNAYKIKGEFKEKKFNISLKDKFDILVSLRNKYENEEEIKFYNCVINEVDKNGIYYFEAESMQC